MVVNRCQQRAVANAVDSEVGSSAYWEEYSSVPDWSRSQQQMVSNSGLSQAALQVRQMYEDGDFDKEVMVGRGETTLFSLSAIACNRHSVHDFHIFVYY